MNAAVFLSLNTDFELQEHHVFSMCEAARRVTNIQGRTSVRQVGQTADQPTSLTNENEQNIALGWNDIQHLTAGDTVSKTYTDTTQATGPVERTIVYQAPFFKPNREEDYAVAWAFFEGDK